MSAAPSPVEPLRPFVPRMLASWDAPTPGRQAVDGTLVYADVSGFTRLTERLAGRGRIGAEEMVTTISDVWAALLGVTGDGDVLKFAGDALILFYRDDDHATRACAAAMAMQRTLFRVGRIVVGKSTVRLRMSIGVHSGRFEMMVVGGEHLDLLVLGPDATRTVALEAAAGPGDVLVSVETTMAATGITVQEERSVGMRLRITEPVMSAPRQATADRLDIRRFVSPMLRERLVTGTVSSEHRRVCVGFAQVVQVDSMLENDGASAVFDLVQHLVGNLATILDEYRVLLTSCDLASDGSIFMMSAGAPDSEGDDEARMLRVARWIVDVDSPLPRRVGVHAGSVFAGVVGPSTRRSFVTMGDTTNLAARVMMHSPWGSVLATNETVRAASGRFEVHPVEPFHAKGKRQPIEASIVGQAHDGGAHDGGAHDGGGDLSASRLTPFVGRRREREILLEALADARSGHGRVIELVGDQGTGKSRLVDSLTADANDMTWMVTASDPFERTTPHHMSRVLLRSMIGVPLDASPADAGRRLLEMTSRIAPELMVWTPLIAVPMGADVPATSEVDEVAERFRRVRTQRAVADFVDRVATRPTVVVIEDAEHLDDASAEMVAEVFRRASERPWLALVTRTADTSGLHRGRGYDATVIDLGPLDLKETTELAYRLAERSPVPSHLLSELITTSAGNPLFLSELLAHAVIDGGEMPNTVEGIIAVRIDCLSPDDRRTLRCMSVLGERFDLTLVDVVLSDMGISTRDVGLWARLADFVERDGDSFSFANPLIRRVAYAGLPYRERREIHSRVADALGDEAVDRLPFHLLEAERWSEAWMSARDAGDRARRAGANAVAGELYSLALRAASSLSLDPAEVAQVADRAGHVWARAGIPQRALDAFATAIARTADPVDRLLLEAQRAAVHEDAGRYPQALRLYARSLTESDRLVDEQARLRVQALHHAGYASTRNRQGRFQEAAQHADQAAHAAQMAGDRHTYAQALHMLDRIHVSLGDRDGALRFRDAALPVFAELGDLAAQGTVLHDLAEEAQRDDRLAEALWLYQRAVDSRSRAGDVVRAAASINSLGEVEAAMGMVEEAERHFTEALRSWRGARSPEGIAHATTNLGSLRLKAGHPAEAVDLLEEAVRLAADIGAESVLGPARIGLAEGYLGLGRLIEAWECASEVLRSSTSEHRRAHFIRAEALEATGGIERAAQERALAVDPVSDVPSI